MSSTSSSSESSLLLWFLAALVYWLAAHVALGGLRDVQRDAGVAAARRPVLVAGLAIGAALCTGIVLSLTSLGLNVQVGFRIDAAAALWLLAAAAGVAVAAGLAWRREPAAWVVAGVTLALLATAVHWSWVMAAGFRPGIAWSGRFVAAAGVLAAVCSSIALALGLGENAQHGRLRVRWRLAASVLMALGWVLGQELLLAGASLGTQVGSLYRQQLTAPLLSMLLGTVVPLALLVALFEQMQRRRQRARDGRSRRQGGAGQQVGLAYLTARHAAQRRSAAASGGSASSPVAATSSAAQAPGAAPSHPAADGAAPAPPPAPGQADRPPSTIGGP